MTEYKYIKDVTQVQEITGNEELIVTKAITPTSNGRLSFSKFVAWIVSTRNLISNKDIATTQKEGIVKKAKSVDSNKTLDALITSLKEAGILE